MRSATPATRSGVRPTPPRSRAVPARASRSTSPQQDSASPTTTASAWSAASSGRADAWMPPRTTFFPAARHRSAYRYAQGAVAVQTDFGNGMLRENLQVIGLDATLSLLQRQVDFDIDDVDGAIAELDRQADAS